MEKFKRFVKQLVVCFAILLLVYSCQKDDAVPLASQTQQLEHATTKSVAASEIPKVMQFLESKNNRLEFLVDDSNSELGMNLSHEENLSITNALAEHIKMVTNGYGKSNYTFELIEQGDKTGIYFINLVVKEYKDELYMYIVKYVPDATWLETHHISRDFNDFTGDMYFYGDNGAYIGKIAMANGSATSGFQKHPCDGDDDESSENENNTDGTSSGWDGGSTGGNSVSGDSEGTGGWGIHIIWDCCWCEGQLVGEHDHVVGCSAEIFIGGGASYSAGENLSATLRHPCDGGSNGGGTSSLSCETITGTTCDNVGNTLMEWDANCNCVEAQTIENSQVAVAYSDKEHCKKLNELWEVQNLKSQIQTLKSGSIVNNDNFTSEKGFKTFIDSNGNLNVASIQTGASNGSFRYGTGVNVAVGVHTHPSVRFPMFSVDDILNLHGFYENVINSDLPVSPQTPAHLLVTKQGVYALKIEDPALFAIYYATFLSDYKRIKDERSKLEKKYRRYFDEINNQQGNSGQHKLAFLRYAKNIGVSLYQANDDLTNWTKYEISENNLDLVPFPCK